MVVKEGYFEWIRNMAMGEILTANTCTSIVM